MKAIYYQLTATEWLKIRKLTHDLIRHHCIKFHPNTGVYLTTLLTADDQQAFEELARELGVNLQSV